MGDIRTRCPPIRGEEHRALLSRTDFLWILFSIDKPESKSQAHRPRQAKSHPKVGLRAVTIILRSQFYKGPGLVPINCKSSLLCSKTSYFCSLIWFLLLYSILRNAQDRIRGDERKKMRAFIVSSDNEAEWLLYGAESREELSKLIRLSRLRLLMDFLCSPKIHTMPASRSRDIDANCLYCSSYLQAHFGFLKYW